MNVKNIGITPTTRKVGYRQNQDFWEIILNLEGEGIGYIGENEYRFFPGSIICIPPNIIHSKTAKNEFKDIYIQIYRFISPFPEDKPVFFIDDETKSIENLLLMAIKFYYKKDLNYEVVVELLLETIFQLLISWNINDVKDKDMELFKNVLIENYTNPEFSISDAYKKISYSCDYFRRCFKKYTGFTPNSYLTNLRIEHAKKLLSQKSNIKLSIAKISLSSGFYDANYFSRIFKMKTGVTPQKFIDIKNDVYE